MKPSNALCRCTLLLTLLASGGPAYLGAAAPPRQVADLEQTNTPLIDTFTDPPSLLWGSHPSQLLPGPGLERVYFAADNRTHGAELWRTDGTAEGTTMVTDLCPGACGSKPVLLDWLGDKLLFWADDGVHGTELWRTDGTPEGTERVADLCAGPCSGLPDNEPILRWLRSHAAEQSARLGDALYFVATDAQTGPELWRSDGTQEGTFPVADVHPGSGGSLNFFDPIARVGDHIVAPAYTPTTGIDLWAFNDEGATLLFDECDAEDYGYIETLVTGPHAAIYSQVCFDFDTSSDISSRFFESDGTPEGTFLLADLALQNEVDFARLRAGVWLDGRAILHLRVDNDDQLWTTNSSVVGIGLLLDNLPFSTGPLLKFGNRAALRTTGDRLAITDGTLAGTSLLQFPQGVGALGASSDHLLIATPSTDPEAPQELQSYDGTNFETLGELNPRGRFIEIAPLPESGTWLVPGSLDPEEGFELWALDNDGRLPPCSTAPSSQLCLQEGRFHIAVEFRDPRTGQNRNATAVPATSVSGHFHFFGPDNIEVTVKVIDGRSVNGHWWLYVGAVTDLEFDVILVDQLTGLPWSWRRPAGDLCGIADIRAVPDADLPVVSDGSKEPHRLARSEQPVIPPCGDGRLCLQDDRFSVEVTWSNPGTGQGGTGVPVPFADNGSTGAFHFFGAENLELLVKVLDGRPLNGNWWIYWGGLTDLALELTVLDLVTGARRVFQRPAGDLCGAADISALPDAP